jgi:hypothetical protein
LVDDQVDQTTGTVKLKGEFPNADLELWPGQFVNVRVLIDTLQQVVVVPTAAVTQVTATSAEDAGQIMPGTRPRPDGTRNPQTVSARGRTATGRQSMSVSSPFIHRPIATSLLGVAVMHGGLLGYLWLPASAATGRFSHHHCL